MARIAPTVEPNSQLGQSHDRDHGDPAAAGGNSSGRALIKTSQSCGVSLPLTAVLYGSVGTVVQVVRRARVETRQVDTGLMSGGQIEIRDGIAEGDMVVARAGALLREGDPVRPETAGGEGKKGGGWRSRGRRLWRPPPRPSPASGRGGRKRDARFSEKSRRDRPV